MKPVNKCRRKVEFRKLPSCHQYNNWVRKSPTHAIAGVKNWREIGSLQNMSQKILINYRELKRKTVILQWKKQTNKLANNVTLTRALNWPNDWKVLGQIHNVCLQIRCTGKDRSLLQNPCHKYNYQNVIKEKHRRTHIKGHPSK